MILLKKLKELPNKVVILAIRIYRLLLSPSVGLLSRIGLLKPSCIFYPTCSEYSLICFQKYDFFTAFRKSLNRIGRCNHRNEPSVDLP